MIDTKELRRLAQAATPGPWWGNQDGLNHGFQRGVAEINAKEWHALAGAWAVNGAKPSEEGAANAEFIAAANPATVTELLDRLEAWENVFCHLGTPDEVGNEWHSLSDRLEEIEKERVIDEQRIADLMADLNLVGHENEELRAKVEAMEKQEPVAWCATDETGTVIEALGMNQSRRFDTALYLAPGAQPAPSVPEGWKLVPTAESRHPGIYKMLSALHAVDNTPGASEWASYAAFLAAAPEAKPCP